MAKKLAITIAGAVSLGSYESGVMFEVLDAIRQHNQWADLNDREKRIEIDVLTGASAGGMTAAMIARRILFDGNSMLDPYDNPLYNAWVKSVDITKLLDRGDGEPARKSLFSSNLIMQIANTYLMGVGPVPIVPHPSLPSNGKIKLGLALSNLNGVDYQRPTKSGGIFTYTRFQDRQMWDLDDTNGANVDLWTEIRNAAVSCGAFPFAFRVQDLLRNIADFVDPFLDSALWNGQASRLFAYTDGGVFQNEPIGMAKNLVEETQEGRLTAADRAYLFIAPRPKKSSEIPFTDKTNADPTHFFGSANADYRAVALRLVEAIMGQSEFRDWITAEEINDKLHLLDHRAEQLRNLFTRGTLTPAMVQPIESSLLPLFFPEGGPETLDSARRQLKTQYQDDFDHLSANLEIANAWLDSVLLLEVSGGLHDKEEMKIYDFIAKTELLAGNQLSAFQGFFDVSYRQHDYDYGRTIGQQQIQFYGNQAGGPFANLHWNPRPINPINSSLNDLKMSAVGKALRQKVYTQICGAADDLLEELGANPFQRWAIENFFLNGKIKKILEL